MMKHFDAICFGGAFDPIHMGHVEAVSIALRTFSDSKVIVVPSFVTPKASGQVKATTASFQDRVAMATLAFDDFPQVDVSSIEEELNAPSFTYQTISALKNELGLITCAWMIGADQLAEFAKWKNPKLILAECSLIVIPRPDSEAKNLMDLATAVSKEVGWEVTSVGSLNEIKLSSGQSIYILPDAPMSISSTKVRSWIANQNVRELKNKVPEDVIAYLIDSEVY